MLKAIFRFSFLFLGVSFSAFAQDAGFLHPLPGGSVFSGFLLAPVENPAGLVTNKSNVVGDFFTPGQSGSTSFSNISALALSSGKMAIGASYTHISTPSFLGYPASGSSVTSADPLYSKSISVGAAFKYNDIALGYGFSSPVKDQPYKANSQIGIIFGVDSLVNYALVLRNLNSTTPQAEIGVGYIKESQYNLELEVLLPGFSYLSTAGSQYIFTAAAAVYIERFGLSFKGNYVYTYKGSAYYSNSNNFTSSFNGLVWLTKDVNFLVGTDSSSDLTFGLQGSF